MPLDPSQLQEIIDSVTNSFNYRAKEPLLIVSVLQQKLFFFKDQTIMCYYTVSTAKAGMGNKNGSYQTPTGVHLIAEKIGERSQLGTIFKARKDTGEIARILKKPNQYSGADNITTRILWLSGLEEGFNKGGDVDSKSRYIYIHGTDEEGLLGTAVSHGCIRMKNKDIVELFNQVSVGNLVVITQ